ncbi:MAG: hypothetical protein WC749_02075 [Dehalococcoidia bacterium]
MANDKDSWKNWLIAALWTVTIALATLGYGSIKDSLDKVHVYQAAQLRDWSDWKLDHEKQVAVVWRTLDKICVYQADRLRKEGTVPNYAITGPSSK